MLSVLVHLVAMRLSVLSFSAHLASLLLTSDVKGRCQSVGEGVWFPPTGHLTAVGRAKVTLQAVFSASASLFHTATIGIAFDCEVAL